MQVLVKALNRVVAIEMELDKTIEDLKKEIAKRVNIPAQRMVM